MEAFEKELRLSFLEEAIQLLSDVEQCYLQLEVNPNDSALIDQIFRVAHNIKGSARAVGFSEVGGFAHEFENLLLKIKNTEIEATQAVTDLLLKCNDHLTTMVYKLKDDLYATFDSQFLFDKISEALRGELTELPIISDDIPDESQFEEVSSEPVTHTIDETPSATNSQFENFESASALSASSHNSDDNFAVIDSDNNVESELKFNTHSFAQKNAHSIKAEAEAEKKMGTSMQATTPASEKSANSQQPPGSSASGGGSSHGSTDESIRVSLSRLETLLNYVGEMVILHAVLKEQTIGSSLLIRKTVHQLGKATKEVQDISMGLRMVPIRQTFQKMQRIVRDTTGELGKKVKLVLEGEDTELDKTILERISDPLVHLVRNACDHGIESPAKRIASGKSESGVLKLSAYHQSGKLIIKIADDGGGINPELLRRKAIEKKIISPTSQLSDREAINLIFHPGFSTKSEVTDVSGRGVGMDVVKINIEAIQGEVITETEIGKGTTFRIILPLTLAIIDAMVIKLNDLRYIIPLSHIQESVKLETRDIKKTSGLGDILLLRGDNIPLFHLTDLLSRKQGSRNDSNQNIALVIKSSQETFAVVVDDIIGQYQVVIKKLGNEIHGLKGVSGSAILGDGKPALILELAELVNKTKKSHTNDMRGVAA